MKFTKVLKGGLAAGMMLSMAACSSGGSASGSTSSSAFKIGASGPITGGAAVYGLAVKNAAEMAVAEVNALGGIQLELNFQDDTHDAEKAVTAYGVLKDWGMQASIGTVTSSPGAAVSGLYQEDNIFALTPSASSVDVIYNSATKSSYGTVFQMCFTDPNQGVASADYLAAHTDLGSKVAVIWKNDDNYSTGVHEKFVAEAAVVGLEIVSDTTFDDSSATDFNVQLQQAKDAGADILFLPIYYQPAASILTQANTMGYAPTVFGVDGLDGILSQEGFDTSLAEGVYLLTPFSADATDEKTAAFVKNYVEKYGETPNQFAADAYDCIYAIYQALTAANATPDMSTDDITAALLAQFTSMTFDGVTGTSVTWESTGEVSKSPKAVVIQNGVYVGVQD